MTYVIDSFLFLHNSALFACQANVDVSKLSDGKLTRSSKTQSDFFANQIHNSRDFTKLGQSTPAFISFRYSTALLSYVEKLLHYVFCRDPV